jgi:hypothetical protein
LAGGTSEGLVAESGLIVAILAESAMLLEAEMYFGRNSYLMSLMQIIGRPWHGLSVHLMQEIFSLYINICKQTLPFTGTHSRPMQTIELQVAGNCRAFSRHIHQMRAAVSVCADISKYRDALNVDEDN